MKVQFHFRSTPVIVQQGTSIEFLTKTLEQTVFVRFYDVHDTLHEVRVSDVASVSE